MKSKTQAVFPNRALTSCVFWPTVASESKRPVTSCGRTATLSLQGAGGIGGLLSRTEAASGQTAWYHADGNGNVTAMVNAPQVVVVKYTYDLLETSSPNSA